MQLKKLCEHFQDNEKIHESDPDTIMQVPNDTLYPHTNDIEYSLFEDVIDSYSLENQIKDGFSCNKDCYNSSKNTIQTQMLTSCTHAYDHITQQINNLSDTTQQQLHTMEESASLFTSDTTTNCNFNIVEESPSPEPQIDNNQVKDIPKGILSQSKYKYRNTFGNANVQYHSFDNGDAFTFQDKYTALLQQEFQNPYWCLHDPITPKATKFLLIWI